VLVADAQPRRIGEPVARHDNHRRDIRVVWRSSGRLPKRS
jgi:hypothetical protein